MGIWKLVTIAVAVTMSAPNSVANATERFTFLATQSEPGEVVDNGESAYYDLSTHLFTAYEGLNSSEAYFGVYIVNRPPTYRFTDYWFLVFHKERGGLFNLGDYETTPNYSVWMYIEAIGSVLDPVTGNFQILEYDFTNPDEPHVAVNFEIHVRGSVPALRGQLRVNSVFGIPEPSTVCLLLTGLPILFGRHRRVSN